MLSKFRIASGRWCLLSFSSGEGRERERKGEDGCCAPNVQELVCREMSVSVMAHQETSVFAMRPSCKEGYARFLFLHGLSIWSLIRLGLVGVEAYHLSFLIAWRRRSIGHVWWWFWSPGLAICALVECHRFVCHCSKFIFGVISLVLVSSLSCRFKFVVRDMIFNFGIFWEFLVCYPPANGRLFVWESSPGCNRGCCGRKLLFFFQERYEHIIDLELLLFDVTKLVFRWI